MKIAIIDAEIVGKKRHRFPNIVCMKISSYWKSRGAFVELKTDYENLEQYDKVIISKVFTDTEIPKEPEDKTNKRTETISEWYANNEFLKQKNIEYGGTGFFYDTAPNLPCEVEHAFPDYSLYEQWVNAAIAAGAKPEGFKYYTKYSIGYATRGCFRKCTFCVNKSYSKCEKHSDISEWVDNSRPYICCLDDNVLACAEWKEIFHQLQATGKRFQFKQGCDERLLTDEKCQKIFSYSKWIGDYIFAFDNIQDADLIQKKLRLIRYYSDTACKFYVFCGYNHITPESYNIDFWERDIAALFQRIEILLKWGCLPYIMRYKDYDKSPYRGIYITLARWCNQPSFLKKMTFREFCIANGEKSSAFRYFMDLLTKHPELSSYCDIRFQKGRVTL